MFGAETGERPAIFAPVVPRPAAPAAVSERSRALLQSASKRVLEEAVVFEGPTPDAQARVDVSTGATVMAPVSDALYEFIGKAVCGLPVF